MRSANDHRIAIPPSGNDSVSKMLIVGIGNCGRADDGLGWAFLDQLEAENTSSITPAYRYQLQIEDADLISQYASVVFVDATEEELPEGFQWRECPAPSNPESSFTFSTHALAPEAVVSLCKEIFNVTPQTYILAIQGYDWDLKESLSAGAQQNLLRAWHFFQNTVKI